MPVDHPNMKIINKIILDLLSAIEYVHSKDYVHRDLKPGNIVISEKYEIQVIDFGAGKEAKGDKTVSTLHAMSDDYSPHEIH